MMSAGQTVAARHFRDGILKENCFPFMGNSLLFCIAKFQHQDYDTKLTFQTREFLQSMQCLLFNHHER